MPEEYGRYPLVVRDRQLCQACQTVSDMVVSAYPDIEYRHCLHCQHTVRFVVKKILGRSKAVSCRVGMPGRRRSRPIGNVTASGPT